MFVGDVYRAWRSTHRVAVRKRWRSVLHAYVAALTLGSLCMVFFLIYMPLGKFRIVGLKKLILALLRGKVIIAANHPAVLESLFLSMIGALSGPLLWVAAPALWPYSLPDPKTFLPRKWWWVFKWFRCITVDREDEQHAQQGALQAIARLKYQGASVALHPEGGRTFTKKEKDGEYIFGPCGRRIRPLKDGVSAFLRIKDVRVLPVWVQFDGPFIDQKHSFWHLFSRGMTIYIGDLYNPREGLPTSPQMLEMLGERILAAGLEN